MADLSKLKAALRRTAADGLSGFGPQSFSAPEAAAAMLLDQIDASLMGRRVIATLDDGSEIVLEVGARRLLRFAAPLKDGPAVEVGAELKPSDAGSVAKAILAALSGRSSLEISTEPNADAGDVSDAGVPVGLLKAALGIAETPAQTDPEAHLNMEPFIAAIGESCLAALWIQGEDASLVNGDEARVAKLSEWAAAMLERLLSPEFPLAAGLETDGIAVFVLPDAAKRHAFIAGRVGAYLVAEMNGADPARTLELWHKFRD